MRPADAHALRERHPDVEWVAHRGRRTTAFRNTYRHGVRTQRMPRRAGPLGASDLEGLLGAPRIVHLAPVAAEIGPSIVPVLPVGALIGLTAQGLVRRTDVAGRVQWRPWRARRDLLRAADIVILSTEDIREDPRAGRAYLDAARLGILTRGSESIELFRDGVTTEVPVAASAGKHARTGTGDVFAAAFFTEFAAGASVERALAFAAAAGAVWVARHQRLVFPGRADIERRLVRRP